MTAKTVVVALEDIHKELNEINSTLQLFLRNISTEVACNKELSTSIEKSDIEEISNCSKENDTFQIDSSLDFKISNIIKYIGCPAHLKGYEYIITAIKMCLDDPGLLHSITKLLYPKTADEHCTTPSRVERAIRHCIEVAWLRGNVDELQNIFGYTISASKGKPTNSEFLATIVEYIKLH